MSVACPEANRAALKWPGWSFAFTILVSAFLLFQVQPLVSKCILPWFGGCPAVWTTCMLFFQMLLFGGYAYADLSQRFLSPRRQVTLHLILVVAALLLMPIAPGTSWKPIDADYPTGRILLLLTCTVGLPYFVLSATSPLVQSWFSRTYPGRSPYRLYSLSNVGSLAALLSYPFYFEWAMDLPHQSWLWSGGFATYVVLCGVCLLCLRGLREPRPEGQAGTECGSAGCCAASPASSGQTSAPSAPTSPMWPQRLLWVLLPACASLMLLATTNHVCQDVTPVPFLWVVPLSLYLLSFIVCFDHARWYLRGVWVTLTVLAVVAVVIFELTDWLGSFDFVQGMTLYFAMLFFVCMTCHGELVRLKPHPRHLTEFYLLIAAGGALGGAAVSLIAPLVFTTFLEWEIGLLVCFALAIVVLGRATLPRWVWPLPALALLVYGVFVFWSTVSARFDDDEVIARSRSFYGVVSVEEWGRDDPAGHEFVLFHGGIKHGRQYADEKKRRIPTTYYTHNSGVGRALDYCSAASNGRSLRVGAVGLGVGTLAAYARPGDDYRFYEINPDILRLAEDYFHFLSDCRGACDVVMGDARLTLERELRDEGSRKYDVLVLDAFSGDFVPAHLLTTEAFKLYGQHMAPDGVIAVHVTNSYLYLTPVVRGLAEEHGWEIIRVYIPSDGKELAYRSDWMLLTRNEKFLRAVKPSPPPEDMKDNFSVPLWTDQYNNLFQILMH